MRTKHLVFVLIHIRNKGEVGAVKHVKPSRIFTDRFKAVLLLWILFVICVLCVSVFSVHCILLVTCWKSAYLLALLFVMFSSVFITSLMVF